MVFLVSTSNQTAGASRKGQEMCRRIEDEGAISGRRRGQWTRAFSAGHVRIRQAANLRLGLRNGAARLARSGHGVAGGSRRLPAYLRSAVGIACCTLVFTAAAPWPAFPISPPHHHHVAHQDGELVVLDGEQHRD